SSLTQPFSQRQASRNPHRGLYPTYRTKRQEGQGLQRCITEYFKVSQRQSTGNKVAKSREVKEESLDGRLSSMEDHGVLLEHDRDIALAPCGAAASRKRPLCSEGASSRSTGYCKYGGADKKPVLDTSLQSSPEHTEIKQEIKEEPDVIEIDPIPDTYFGLLGTASCKEPAGHIDQLPNEVLSIIFAFLPMTDLCLSLSLVCRRWREIVGDPLFIPWKKLYHQYLMKEAQALLTVEWILGRYGITPEQDQCMLQFIRRAGNTDQILKQGHFLSFFPGTGKTSTLIKYAEKFPHLSFLYVAFNKAIAEHAKTVFPPNVTCKTFHSLAYASVGQHYNEKGKLNFSKLSPYMISFLLKHRKGESLFIRGKTVTQTLESFFASSDEFISVEHTPIWCKNTHGMRTLVREEEKKIIVEEARRIWDNMKILNGNTELNCKMTPDGYLKLWQLRKPRLFPYDAVFVDEAQDCTPAIMDIVLSQNCGKIFVGDPHQQIYSFRGAVNALFAVPHTHIFYLTQSFRFGPEIAYIGATILDVCKKIRNKTLVGGNQEGDVRGSVTGKTAFLSRGNLNVFENAVMVTEGERSTKIHLLGGPKNFGLNKIHDIWKLLQPEDVQKLQIEDHFIKKWVEKDGFQGLKSYAAVTEDRELEVKIAIVEKYNVRIPELVGRIKNSHVSNIAFAEYVLGTVHKAKGLEFDNVVLTDDFVKVPCARHNLRRLPHFSTDMSAEDEWNLLYVAVTRAKKHLLMTKSLEYLLTLAGEYFLRPELTSEALKEGPVHCSVSQCPNVVPAGSVLTMKKVPFAYVSLLISLQVKLGVANAGGNSSCL
uniref:F-box DNA helicase 1 n=1 Tax=Pelusios castaneus TaxID=367368 RepID=A0A8C8R6G3_9SAUR